MRNKFRIRRIRFYSAKVTSIQKSHRLPTEPMGIHHSPHTHSIPIPMGIPIPTAALAVSSPSRVWAEPRRKSNLVHFSLKI